MTQYFDHKRVLSS